MKPVESTGGVNPTRMAAPSPTDSLGLRTVCGRTEQRRLPVLKRYETKFRMVWGVFLLLQQRLKLPREVVITPKAATSLFGAESAGFRSPAIILPTPIKECEEEGGHEVPQRV